MDRRLFRLVTLGIAFAAVAGALIYGGITAYCFADVSSFYANVVELPGTIADVKSLAGGPAPLVTFVDPFGQSQEVQFSPFYETSPNAVGQQRTVLYNRDHRPHQALASPWNWVGSIANGAITLCFGAIAAFLYLLTPGAAATAQALGNGE